MNVVHRKWFGDLMFLIQIAGAFLICGGQFFRFLETTEGQSFSALILIQIALAFNLMLAIPAHRNAPSRVSTQVLWSLTIWSLFNLTNIYAVLVSATEYRWGLIDDTTVGLAVLGAIVVMILTAIQGRAPSDPAVKGVIALACRMTPWILMAYKITLEGNGGVPALSIYAGIFTTGARVVQTWLILKASPDDRSAKWLFFSETGTCLSWLAITVVWFVY